MDERIPWTRGVVGYSSYVDAESDMIERLNRHNIKVSLKIFLRCDILPYNNLMFHKIIYFLQYSQKNLCKYRNC